MGKFINLTGQKFGRLTVVERVENNKNGGAMWLCKCKCNGECIVSTMDLKTGKTKSCGCYRLDRLKENRKKHGMSKSHLYHVWQHMKQRCYDPKSNRFEDYGGRGITICDEWLNDFNAFAQWALSHGYADSLTIDRINNDGNYCPENCRWITLKEQANNKSNNAILIYKGKKQTLAQWSDDIGISAKTIQSRLRRGWGIEKALTTQIRLRNKKKGE